MVVTLVLGVERAAAAAAIFFHPRVMGHTRILSTRLEDIFLVVLAVVIRNTVPAAAAGTAAAAAAWVIAAAAAGRPTFIRHCLVLTKMDSCLYLPLL